MAQVAKDHHFVPVCYLAAFTDTGTEDGRLYVFDFEVGRFFRRRPRNVAFEKHFNRVEIDGQPPDTLEKAFGQFEGQAISVVRSICSEGDLPPRRATQLRTESNRAVGRPEPTWPQIDDCGAAAHHSHHW